MAVQDKMQRKSFLSVIVPIYREPQEGLESLLDWIDECSSPEIDWIFVGVVGDQSFESIERKIKAPSQKNKSIVQTKAQISVLSAPQGRSKQMNTGARRAQGEVLLFLHADTSLDKSWADSLKSAIVQRKSRWGAFCPRIEAEGLVYRVAERWGLWRSRRLGLPYGDQGIFVEAELFWALGGFDEAVQFMEEVDLASRLNRSGKKPMILPVAAFTSSRKWTEHGMWHSVKNLIAFALYMLGIPREQIRRWYTSK